jgi:hypothetical protein
MASVQTSGSQTATLTTEHTLATVTDAGQYVLAVDAANLVDGEDLTLRIYGKARSSDTERVMYVDTFTGAQAAPLLISLPTVSPHHNKFTLEQNGGTGRAFPWAVYQID